MPQHITENKMRFLRSKDVCHVFKFFQMISIFYKLHSSINMYSGVVQIHVMKY